MDVKITTDYISAFLNDSPVISLFFFCMWGITLFLLVRKDYPVKRTRKKPREVNDYIQLLRAYLVIPAIALVEKFMR